MTYAQSWRVLDPVHVLLVEDDPLMAFNLRRILRRCPEFTTVTVAVDGRDALDRLRSGAGHTVVLTDLSMPRMSGLEFVAAIRADAALRHLRIVILTSSTDDADRAAAVALQIAGYFVKSAELPHFLAVRACLSA